jgi:hypothetical protein
MTRMHDGSLPPLLQSPLLQSETSVQGPPAPDRTAEAARLVPSGGEEPPVRGALVTYEEFKHRRQLRLRVTAAFEKLERECTLDGEFRAVPHVQAPTTGDETP